MSSTDVSDWLRQVCAELSLPITERQLEQLRLFHVELSRWGQVINLSGVRDAREMLALHFADCLAVVAAVSESLPPAGALLDIGSGAGLPALILAIMLPTNKVVSVDKVAKKIAFQRHVATVLQLQNLQALDARIEAVPSLGMDACICRAFADLDHFLRLCAPHVHAGKAVRAFAMKGRLEHEPTPQQAHGWHLLCSKPLHVPQLAATRHLLIYERV